MPVTIQDLIAPTKVILPLYKDICMPKCLFALPIWKQNAK